MLSAIMLIVVKVSVAAPENIVQIPNYKSLKLLNAWINSVPSKLVRLA
jgi:hypothetical protein